MPKPSTVLRVVLVVSAMTAAFLIVDHLQPTMVTCWSHGEPNCARLDELHAAARAQRSLLAPALAAVVTGVLSYAVVRMRP
jgi:hypothetical protein